MNGAVVELLDAGDGLSDVGVEAGGHVLSVHVLKGFTSQELVRGIQLSEYLRDGFAIDWGLVGDVEVSGFFRIFCGGLLGRGYTVSGGEGGCIWCRCCGCCSGSGLWAVFSHGGSLFICPFG